MNKDILSAGLPEAVDIFSLDEIDSTNTYAKALAAAGKIPREAVITAASQTAGRGRRGRSFLSPRGGIYMTYVSASAPAAGDLCLVTPAAAVAVRSAIKKICRIDCGIKWVNDILLGDKKVCGILTELQGNHIIIGIGINWQRAGSLPPQLDEVAAWLHTGPAQSTPEALAAQIIIGLRQYLSCLPGRSFLDEYRSASVLLGRQITVHGATAPYPATAQAIDDDCRLIVRLADGSTRALGSGEVSVRL